MTCVGRWLRHRFNISEQTPSPNRPAFMNWPDLMNLTLSAPISLLEICDCQTRRSEEHGEVRPMVVEAVKHIYPKCCPKWPHLHHMSSSGRPIPTSFGLP